MTCLDGLDPECFKHDERQEHAGYTSHDDVEDRDEVAHQVDEWLRWLECSREADDPEVDVGTFVFRFPRANSEQYGGEVDMQKEQDEDPLDRALRIFTFNKKLDTPPHDIGVDTTRETGFPELLGGDVSEETYQNCVRKKFLQILTACGVQLSSFPSIDEDEVFVKAWLDRDKDTRPIEAFAATYQWSMPFKEEAYTSSKMKVPVNASGEKVVAYTEYTDSLKDDLKKFRAVDEIRMLYQFMTQWVDLSEMYRQHIFTWDSGTGEGWFLLWKPRRSSQLARDWGSFRYILCPPSQKDADLIRDHFGEQIAFFYMWLAILIRHFLFLAVLGAISGAIEMIFIYLDVFPTGDRLLLGRLSVFAFALFLFFWIPFFIGRVRTMVRRKNQKWGPVHLVKEMTNKDYLHCKEWVAYLRMGVSYCCTVAYIVFGISLTTAIQHAVNASAYRSASWASMPVSLTIVILNFIYGNFVVVMLERVENKRLKVQQERSLAFKLTLVKIILALYPLVYTGFMKKFLSIHHGASVEAVAGELYKDKVTDMNFTRMVQVLKTTEALPVTECQRLYNGDSYCIGGCFPDICIGVVGQEYQPSACVTNCVLEIRRYLMTYFISYLGIDIFFLVFPIIRTQWIIRREICTGRQRKEKLEESKRLKLSSRTHHERDLGWFDHDEKYEYKYLEFQAKLDKYQYNGWGGGPVDDFLEFAIMFSITTAFGVTYPLVFVIAALAFLFMYRLMAVRLVYVTQRPFPVYQTDLGVWDSVFVVLGTLAIVTNTAVVCFVMYPLRNIAWRFEMFVFIIVEHFVLFAVYLSFSFFPEVPGDVEVVEAKNQDFLKNKVDLDFHGHADECPDDVDLSLNALSRSTGTSNTSSLRSRLHGS